MPSPQEEFTHPVIAAMQNAFQLMQNAKDQKFKQELDTRQADLADQQFQEAQKQHAIDKEFKDKNLEIALEELKQSLRKNHLMEAQALQDYAAKGGKAQKADLNIPGMTNDLGQVGPDINVPNAGNSVLPGTNIQFDPANYQTQDEALQRQLDALRQSHVVTNQADEPFKIADEQRQQQARLNEIGLQGTNAAKVATQNHQNDIELANIHGHFALEAARIAHQQGREDLAPVFNGALNSIMDGQTAYTTLPKDIKEGVSQLAATKGWTLPTNQKDYSTKLDAVTGIQGLLDQYRELANNYSRDSPNTGLLGKASAFVTGGGAVPGTDLRAKLDALKSNGGALASFFDKQQRKSDAEILRQVVGLFDPRATVKQNIDKIQQHVGPLNNAVKGIFAGFKPDQLNYVLNNRGIKDIGGFDTGASPTNLRQKYGY